MNKSHKHAGLIKQWADGAEIEALGESTGDWYFCGSPAWSEATTYRVKPQPVECWVIEYIDRTTSKYSYSTEGRAKAVAANWPHSITRIVHMREVTE
jgi:hypothetical protein